MAGISCCGTSRPGLLSLVELFQSPEKFPSYLEGTMKMANELLAGNPSKITFALSLFALVRMLVTLYIKSGDGRRIFISGQSFKEVSRTMATLVHKAQLTVSQRSKALRRIGVPIVVLEQELSFLCTSIQAMPDPYLLLNAIYAGLKWTASIARIATTAEISGIGDMLSLSADGLNLFLDARLQRNAFQLQEAITDIQMKLLSVECEVDNCKSTVSESELRQRVLDLQKKYPAMINKTAAPEIVVAYAQGIVEILIGEGGVENLSFASKTVQFRESRILMLSEDLVSWLISGDNDDSKELGRFCGLRGLAGYGDDESTNSDSVSEHKLKKERSIMEWLFECSSWVLRMANDGVMDVGLNDKAREFISLLESQAQIRFETILQKMRKFLISGANSTLKSFPFKLFAGKNFEGDDRHLKDEIARIFNTLNDTFKSNHPYFEAVRDHMCTLSSHNSTLGEIFSTVLFSGPFQEEWKFSVEIQKNFEEFLKVETSKSKCCPFGCPKRTRNLNEKQVEFWLETFEEKYYTEIQRTGCLEQLGKLKKVKHNIKNMSDLIKTLQEWGRKEISQSGAEAEKFVLDSFWSTMQQRGEILQEFLVQSLPNDSPPSRSWHSLLQIIKHAIIQFSETTDHAKIETCVSEVRLFLNKIQEFTNTVGASCDQINSIQHEVISISEEYLEHLDYFKSTMLIIFGIIIPETKQEQWFSKWQEWFQCIFEKLADSIRQLKTSMASVQSVIDDIKTLVTDFEAFVIEAKRLICNMDSRKISVTHTLYVSSLIAFEERMKSNDHFEKSVECMILELICCSPSILRHLWTFHECLKTNIKILHNCGIQISYVQKDMVTDNADVKICIWPQSLEDGCPVYKLESSMESIFDEISATPISSVDEGLRGTAKTDEISAVHEIFEYIIVTNTNNDKKKARIKDLMGFSYANHEWNFRLIWDSTISTEIMGLGMNLANSNFGGLLAVQADFLRNSSCMPVVSELEYFGRDAGFWEGTQDLQNKGTDILKKGFALYSQWTNSSRKNAWRARACIIHQIQVVKSTLIDLIVQNRNDGKISSKLDIYLKQVQNIFSERDILETKDEVRVLLNTNSFANDSWNFQKSKWADPSKSQDSHKSDFVADDLLLTQYKKEIEQQSIRVVVETILPGLILRMETLEKTAETVKNIDKVFESFTSLEFSSGKASNECPQKSDEITADQMDRLIEFYVLMKESIARHEEAGNLHIILHNLERAQNQAKQSSSYLPPHVETFRKTLNVAVEIFQENSHQLYCTGRSFSKAITRATPSHYRKFINDVSKLIKEMNGDSRPSRYRRPMLDNVLERRLNKIEERIGIIDVKMDEFLRSNKVSIDRSPVVAVNELFAIRSDLDIVMKSQEDIKGSSQQLVEALTDIQADMNQFISNYLTQLHEMRNHHSSFLEESRRETKELTQLEIRSSHEIKQSAAGLLSSLESKIQDEVDAFDQIRQSMEQTILLMKKRLDALSNDSARFVQNELQNHLRFSTGPIKKELADMSREWERDMTGVRGLLHEFKMNWRLMESALKKQISLLPE
jgi:hypothetical protein